MYPLFALTDMMSKRINKIPDLVIYSNLKDGAFSAFKMEAKFKISI